MARVNIRYAILLPWISALASCASNDVLFARYDDRFCATSELASAPVSVEKTVEKEVFREKLVVQEVLAVARQLPWEPAVYFDSDVTKLSEPAVQTLSNNLKFLKRMPHYNISIRGFTDQHASYEYNRKLSGKRTSTVVEYFTQRGVEKNRLVLQAHGESIALGGSESIVADEISRRVEMILLDEHGRPAVTFQNVTGQSGR